MSHDSLDAKSRSRGPSGPPTRDDAGDPPFGRSRFINRPRLRDFDYTGMCAYHVTLVSAGRGAVLLARADSIMRELENTAAATDFEILVYTIMPDHIHLLVSGTTTESNLVRFVKHFKQITSYVHKHETGSHLWQPSFHDHALRRGEDINEVARYVLNNPVRAGLAASFDEWAYCGGSWLSTRRRTWRSAATLEQPH